MFVQVEMEVAEAKPDGCPISDLVLGPKSKGAQVWGRFGDVAVSNGRTAIFFSKQHPKGPDPGSNSIRSLFPIKEIALAPSSVTPGARNCKINFLIRL